MIGTLPARPSSPVPAERPHPLPVAGLLAALAGLVAGAGTALVPGVLHGPAVMQGSARGTGLVLAALAVPLLLAGLAASRRGSDRGVLVRLGADVYVVYNAVLLLFATPFNALFPAYVVLLGAGLADGVTTAVHLDAEALARRAAGVPARSVAAYVAVIAAGNVLVWLRIVLPALGDPSPAFLAGTGTIQNPLHVQDLAVWLPLALLGAAWLWRRRPWGYVVAGTYLVFWTVEAVGVCADQWLGHRADPSSSVASVGGAVLFAVLGVVGLVPLAAFLRATGRTGSCSRVPSRS